MENKNKYEHLADLLSDDNKTNDTSAGFCDDVEAEKLMYFWEHAKLEDFDPSTIALKTTQKIKRRKKLTILKYASVAASILIIVASGLFLYNKNHGININQGEEVAQVAETQDWPEEVVIINSADEKIVVNQDELVKYTEEGDIATGIKDVEKSKNTVEQPAEGYNHLIVPKGKRSRIELSDGTRMWVNSGTKVTYPRTFGSVERKIYVQGEVYLEVKKDVSRPFIVSSDNFDLRVLGTKFNITSYPGTNYSNVVLVEGAVQVDDLNHKRIKLSPHEMLEFDNGSMKNIQIVDTHYYTSWIDGYMMLNGKTLAEIAKRISMYYGTEVQCEWTVRDIKIYGKLALKEDLSEIIEAIENIIPVKTEISSNRIRFSEK